MTPARCTPARCGRRTAPFAQLAFCLLAPCFAAAQTTPTPTPPESTPPVAGTVLFSTEHPPAALAATNSSSSQAESPVEPGPPDERPALPVTNTERSLVAITAYRLDLHLMPAKAREEARAELTIRNLAATPVRRLALQLSSTLRWQSIAARTTSGLAQLVFTQSPIATDADHTGYAQEAVIALPEPLAPGRETTLAVFYSGAIAQNADRLTLVGAPEEKANASDWDAITPTTDQSATALRGFGDVLWYPVAEPTAAFGDGNRLFELIRQVRLHDAATQIALRLTVEYVGDPPDAAIFDGRVQPLVKAPDSQNSLVAETFGVASTSFAAAPIGFRAPNLFLTAQRPVITDGNLLSVITPDPGTIAPYAEAAGPIAAQLTAWLGPGPTKPLTLLDHAGEPFEDETLLVGRLSQKAHAEAIAPELVRGLTHAWFNPQAKTSIWLNSGVAELMAVIATENLLGRDAAIKQLQQAYVLLALSEPAATGSSSSATDSASNRPGLQTPAQPAQPVAPQPLIDAYSDSFVRSKSLAVLWQLREQLGEEMLRKVLTTYRRSLSLDPTLDSDPNAFETSLERTTGKDFSWLFKDWVLNDRGLPDLSIGDANARPLPARAGVSDGYLVAVEVKNEGGAVADVPVTVSNSALTATQRVRVPAHSIASVRIVFTGDPEQVQVNDGSMPEVGALVHTAQVHRTSTP